MTLTTLDIVRERHGGLAELVDDFVPRDTDQAYTQFYRQQWLAALPKARRVLVKWVDDYGWKLRASWFGSDGAELISVGHPQKRAESLREFIRRWESHMKEQGITVRIEWDDHFNGSKPGSRVAS